MKGPSTDAGKGTKEFNIQSTQSQLLHCHACMAGVTVRLQIRSHHALLPGVPAAEVPHAPPWLGDHSCWSPNPRGAWGWSFMAGSPVSWELPGSGCAYPCSVPEAGTSDQQPQEPLATCSMNDVIGRSYKVIPHFVE